MAMQWHAVMLCVFFISKSMFHYLTVSLAMKWLPNANAMAMATFRIKVPRCGMRFQTT